MGKKQSFSWLLCRKLDEIIFASYKDLMVDKYFSVLEGLRHLR